MKKTTRDYWDNLWESDSDAKAFDPNAADIHQWVNQRFHAYFSNIFQPKDTKGKKLLEVGCGRSIWLPYFAKEFGFKVTGIDYSHIGCVLAKKNLRKRDTSGQIICTDFFEPPWKMIEAFDVVVSFGLVEHFDDTALCLQAIVRFLKTEGMLITAIPNMAGLMGILQKFIDREVYHLHHVLDVDALQAAHQGASVSVHNCGYFLSFNSGVVNASRVKVGSKSFFLKSLISSNLNRVTKLVWLFEKAFFSLPTTRFLSPYIVCSATKQQSTKPGIAGSIG